MYNNNQLGSEIRRLMKSGRGCKHKKWTYEFLAGATGFNKDTLGNWVRGKTKPNRFQLSCVLKAFRLTKMERLIMLQYASDNSEPTIYLPENIKDITLDRNFIANAYYRELYASFSTQAPKSPAAYLKRTSALTKRLKSNMPLLKDSLLEDQCLLDFTFELTPSKSKKRNASPLGKRKLNITTSVANSAAATLLRTMNKRFDIPVFENVTSKTSVDLVDSALRAKGDDQSVDGIVISMGAAINMYRFCNCTYIPITLLPGFSVGVVGHNIRTEPSCYYFQSTHLSGSSIVYEDFYSKFGHENLAPYEAIEGLVANNKSAVILGFPYWQILVSSLGTQLMNDPYSRDNTYPTVLFLRKDIAEDIEYTKALVFSLKSTWDYLCMNTQHFMDDINDILTLEYISKIKMVMGFQS